jgi:tetratricopeptide (TPR) repeat protein
MIHSPGPRSLFFGKGGYSIARAPQLTVSHLAVTSIGWNKIFAGVAAQSRIMRKSALNFPACSLTLRCREVRRHLGNPVPRFLRAGRPLHGISHLLVCLLLSVIYPHPGRAQRSQAAAAQSGDRQASLQKELRGGEAALKAGDLEGAERDFRSALRIDPDIAGAYANLGVISIRRRQWEEALGMLRKAEQLAPQVAGIRLNIGLAYFRQNDFRSAIPPFESVVRDEPASTQARYLLGLCYFFVDRWEDAIRTLAPLWEQESRNLSYLYVLGIAAHKAGRTELDVRALSQLAQIGQDSPQFHLIMGKAHLNNERYDQAIAEFESAEKGDPKLPFLHFNLGLAYLGKQDYERAVQEFQQDIAIEPDVAYDYDRLASVRVLQEREDEAEKDFQQALHLDSRLVSSYLGLAEIYQKQNKYPQALAALNSVEKLDPENYRLHYLRGRILVRMGQPEKAKIEFDTYTRMMNAARKKRGKQLSGEIPNPELTVEPE